MLHGRWPELYKQKPVWPTGCHRPSPFLSVLRDFGHMFELGRGSTRPGAVLSLGGAVCKLMNLGESTQLK